MCGSEMGRDLSVTPMDAEYSLVWQKLFEMIRNKFRVYIQAKEQ
jgi:hypothetical protein